MEVIEWSPFMKIRSLNAEVRDNIRFGLEFEKSAFGKYNVDNAVNAGFRYSFWRLLLKGIMAWRLPVNKDRHRRLWVTQCSTKK